MGGRRKGGKGEEDEEEGEKGRGLIEGGGEGGV